MRNTRKLVMLCASAVGMILLNIQFLFLVTFILILREFGVGLTQLKGSDHQFLYCLMLSAMLLVTLTRQVFLINTFVLFLQKSTHLTFMNSSQRFHQPALLIQSQLQQMMFLVSCVLWILQSLVTPTVLPLVC